MSIFHPQMTRMTQIFKAALYACISSIRMEKKNLCHLRHLRMKNKSTPINSHLPQNPSETNIITGHQFFSFLLFCFHFNKGTMNMLNVRMPGTDLF